MNDWIRVQDSLPKPHTSVLVWLGKHDGNSLAGTRESRLAALGKKKDGTTYWYDIFGHGWFIDPGVQYWAHIPEAPVINLIRGTP